LNSLGHDDENLFCVRRCRSAFGVSALYLHFWMRPTGPWLQISYLTTDGYFFLLSVTGLYRVRLRRSRPANCSASLAPTMCRRMKLVEPEDRWVPATTPITSPGATAPTVCNSRSAPTTMPSVLGMWAQCSGRTPQSRFRRLH